MCKFAKIVAAIMLMVAVVCATGCKKSDNDSKPTTEGIYLGVIGFNDQLTTKGISILNSSTLSDFEGFIDDFVARDLTALYYADYVALQKLQSYGEPPQLANVALVTFTDGLDNLSTENNEEFQFDPEGYGTRSAYRNALHNKIVNEKVHGKGINAYTIGLRGNDVSSSEEFGLNMNALSSESSNVFEVANMSEALQKFAEIASSLYSVTTTTSLIVKIPGGVVDDGQNIRFTFDNAIAPNNTIYIECTYNKGVTPRQLDNISYHGFQTGVSSIASVKNEGGYYYFKFENLNLDNGVPIYQSVVNRIVMWKETSTGGGWDKESEFKPDDNTDISVDKSSAIIMLVLDCTTSLGDDFSTMKNAAKRFIETLARSNGSGNNEGGGNGINNGHEYIDLGLPSGTRWATCNVGAMVPEDYGDYFEWGETQGMDDAATVNWGSGWCTPTASQLRELYQNTNNIWTTRNGVEGRLFTSSNGNAIFFPAAGFRDGSSLYHVGGEGKYWSSSLHPDPQFAMFFFFNSNEYFMYDSNMHYEFSIRPVRSVK